jgi:hypothetical protein
MHDPFVVERVSAKRLQQWMRYEQVEPFGELRSDWRVAQIMSMIHNVAVKPSHQKSVEKFLLKFGEKTYKRTPEEEARDLTLLIYAMAGARE